MKKSEKLLDAIGQIDDRYVEEAARAGKQPEDAAAASIEEAADKKKRHSTGGKGKKASVYRWQSALAACAVLAVCVGVFTLLHKGGVLLSPFEGKSGSQEIAAEDTALDTAPEAAPAAEPAPASMEMAPQGRAAAGPAEVPVTVKEAAYSAGKVTFTLVNENEESAILYGPFYYLEQLTDGFWQEVTLKKEVEWKDTGYEIEAGQSREETVDVSSLYGELTAGEYRLVKQCSLIEGDGAGQYPFYVEFMVSE